MNHSSSTIAEHNLLFGILALQMDFIDRDQLVEAMNAWVLDKSRTLEAILHQNSVIADDERELLTALVKKYLEKHGNDTEKSLASISGVDSTLRSQLVNLKDTDVEASLHSLVPSPREDAGLGTTRTISIGQPTSDGGRFRVLRPHAKGGLGEVFVASDSEINREVILKQIRSDRSDNPDSRARFLMEAEITGGLEHPGIVPVYGLGHYADGRPFYAMRFVRGDSLKQAVKRFHGDPSRRRSGGQWWLELRKLLQRFVDVCDAVEYAHSRGVLHRDLKPGNVMLGKFGETLIVDWGLAKHVGRVEQYQAGDEGSLLPASGSGSVTQAGSTIGTPAYMSPEQAAGRLDQLGPASDVYSLGGTLYTLLTGRPPVEDDDVATVLRRVQAGDFPKPREHDAHIPRPLEAICLKAMALSADDRYSSPRAMADDIEAWLADEPVSAYRDSFSARAGRWARHHKVAVSTASVLLFAALLSVSITAVLLAGANRRIRAAQEVAQQNEQTAVENFQLARQAVDDYLTTVSQEMLLNEPGMQAVRRDLLDLALGYYNQFINKHGYDADLQLELANASYRVAQIKKQVGSQDEALQALLTAVEINQRILKGQPDRREVQHNLARCYYSLGSLYQDLGKLRPESLDALEKSIDLLQALVESDPKDSESLSVLEGAYNALGLTYRQLGDLNQTMANYEKSLELDRRLMEQMPDNPEFQNSFASSCHNLAVLLSDMGRHDEAIQRHLTAIEIREQLMAELPRDPLYQEKLSLSYDSLANTYEDLGRYEEAEVLYQKAIELRERLVRENPAVTQYLDLLAGANSNLASLYRVMGYRDPSAMLSLKAVEIWKRLSEQHPGMVEFRSALGTGLYNLGNHYYASEPEKAIEYYRDSITVREQLVQDFPVVHDYRAELAASYNNGASVLEELGERAEAGDLHHKARQLREQLVEKHPEFPEYRNTLASTYVNMAQFDFVTGDEAVDLLNKAVELRSSLVEDYPEVQDYQGRLALTYRAMGNYHSQHGQGAEALAAFEQAIALREKLVSAQPDLPGHRYDLADCYSAYAVIQSKYDQSEAAVASGQRAMEIITELVAEDNDNKFYRRELAGAYLRQAKMHATFQQFDESLTHAESAVQMYRGLAEQDQRIAFQSLLVEGLQTLAAIQQLAGRSEEARQAEQQATEILETLLESNPDNQALLAQLSGTLLVRYRDQVLAGDHSQGTAATEQLLTQLESSEPIMLYNAACVFSLAVQAAGQDESLNEADRQDQSQTYSARALQLLTALRDQDFFSSPANIDSLAEDTDFDPIRTAAEYQQFLDTLPK